MKFNKIFLGNTELRSDNKAVNGEFIRLDGEKFYKISNYNLMSDFFMTIVSDSNHWMFLSSNGSLSAGRKDRQSSLFPYYTDDKIQDYNGITGSKTVILVERDERNYLWEPFSKDLERIYHTERNIIKSVYGNKIIFEEINHDLGLSFSYGWYNSEKFGFVKKSSIQAIDKDVRVKILDGIRNILPNGVTYNFQNEYSNLLDAYKKNELLEESGIALFMLSSIPVDKAEPSESLLATSVWSTTLPNKEILISDNQLDSFKKGFEVTTENDIRAKRGAYYVKSDFALTVGNSKEWLIVSEVNQTASNIANLDLLLLEEKEISNLVEEDIKNGTTNLVKIVASADGIQSTNEELCSARHFSNTLFNVMRGGIYIDNYIIDTVDFRNFVKTINKKVSHNLRNVLATMPEKLRIDELLKFGAKTENVDFIRVCHEYLPLTFSRRHGDPSRPWNQFSIENKNEDGSPKLDFQGNWRDIFQNWEALSISYPEYIESIISKFVNASTADGYNPYRIMRDGIDWESADPDDPWAYIGYWGDHQIIYLLKLLELSSNFHPEKLDELLSKEIFAYANVPYRIKTYQNMILNPQSTIDFDDGLHNEINEKIEYIGSDGRLISLANNKVYHVNLSEKVLLTLLVKLTNFIPEAGIWLNTQRPEWNDANNALVGNGVSMVTLYYLRRYVKFWNDKFASSKLESVSLSSEIKDLFDSIYKLFTENTSVLKKGFYDKERRFFTDILGEAGTTYREQIYSNSFSGNKEEIAISELVKFCELTLEYIDHSIKANRRDDGLYHSYNLISFTEDAISIRHLYEMLEGQVAVLSSTYLNSEQSLEVLDALKSSSLFREDQYSYLLYPDRQLPKFIEKNNIPKEKVSEIELLSQLLKNKDTTILSADNSGNYHFNGKFRNAELLREALNSLDLNTYASLLRKDKNTVLDTYEEMFDHKSFTGRSGTFYGYEGLGSIYWHMVSKLLLVTEECFFDAVDNNEQKSIINRLKEHYYEIKAGIGLYKSPELYGAFPTDAYSHTPGKSGVKQPGMTGQVKEDILSRMGELGIRIIDGEIVFDSHLINQDEFKNESTIFRYINLNGTKQELPLKKNQMAFTLGQIPIVYTLSDNQSISVTMNSGSDFSTDGFILEKEISESVFKRDNKIKSIEVSIIKQ